MTTPKAPSELRILLTANFSDLSEVKMVEPIRCAHDWVNDQSIAEALERGEFENLRIPHHELTHRANRIASVVNLMKKGVIFHPPRIRVRPDSAGNMRMLDITDGNHRLRAKQYLGLTEPMTFMISGPFGLLLEALEGKDYSYTPTYK
jgi:hypothetical protein